MNKLNDVKSLWRNIDVYEKIHEQELQETLEKIYEVTNLNEESSSLEYLLMDIFNYQLKIFNNKGYFIDDELKVTTIDWKKFVEVKSEITVISRKKNYIKVIFQNYTEIEADIATWNKYIISMLHLLEIHRMDGKEISEDVIKKELIDFVNFEN